MLYPDEVLVIRLFLHLQLFTFVQCEDSVLQKVKALLFED